MSGRSGFDRRPRIFSPYARCSAGSSPNFATSSERVSAIAASTSARIAGSVIASVIEAMPRTKPWYAAVAWAVLTV